MEEHNWKLQRQTDGRITATCVHCEAMFAVGAMPREDEGWDIEYDLLTEPHGRKASLSLENALALFHSVSPVIKAFLDAEGH